jgi:ribonuclease BN (tRNA processing enzyme)
MRLTIIGCSGSLPGPESPASSYLLEAEGFRLVLDLGNGALGVLQRHAGLYSIDAVALSHLHADHCLDMCGYWVARRYAPGGPQPPIPCYAPDRAAERLTLANGLEPDPGPGMAYSADTGPSEALAELARDADLLLCEATFPDEPDLPPNLHLSGRQAGEHAARAGARHLVLTHLAQGNDKQRCYAEAGAVFSGPISLAASGQTFELAPSDPLPL